MIGVESERDEIRAVRIERGEKCLWGNGSVNKQGQEDETRKAREKKEDRNKRIIVMLWEEMQSGDPRITYITYVCSCGPNSPAHHYIPPF